MTSDESGDDGPTGGDDGADAGDDGTEAGDDGADVVDAGADAGDAGADAGDDGPTGGDDGADAGDDGTEAGDDGAPEDSTADDRPPRAEDSAFHEWLGLEVVERGDGAATVTVPYADRITNPFGVPHGGIVATAVDVAAGAALSAALGDDAYLATTDLNVQYLEPAGGDLTARAEVVRAGGTVGVVRVDVESTTPDGDAATVAIGSTTYRVFREGRASEGD